MVAEHDLLNVNQTYDLYYIITDYDRNSHLIGVIELFLSSPVRTVRDVDNLVRREHLLSVQVVELSPTGACVS